MLQAWLRSQPTPKVISIRDNTSDHSNSNIKVNHIMGTAASTNGLPHFLRIAGYITLWIAISATVILYNKYLLSHVFPYPITLTMWHMAFCSAAAHILVRLDLVDRATMTSQTFWRAILPISALFAGTLWLGNAAYLYLSVAFIQMLKALMPVSVFVVGCSLGTESFQTSTLVNMIVAWPSVPMDSGLKLTPITMLYYVAPCSVLFLVFPFAFFEGPTVLSFLAQSNMTPFLWVSNALAAFFLNISTFLLISTTSALTLNVSGVIKDWMLIGMSSVAYSDPVSLVSLAGYFISFMGVFYYNYKRIGSAPAQKTPTKSLALKQVAPQSSPTQETALLAKQTGACNV